MVVLAAAVAGRLLLSAMLGLGRCSSESHIHGAKPAAVVQLLCRYMPWLALLPVLSNGAVSACL